MELDHKNAAYKIVAYSAIAFGAVSILSICVTLPMVYNYVSLSKRDLTVDIKYCKDSASEIWVGVTKLRDQPILDARILTRVKRQHQPVELLPKDQPETLQLEEETVSPGWPVRKVHPETRECQERPGRQVRPARMPRWAARCRRWLEHQEELDQMDRRDTTVCPGCIMVLDRSGRLDRRALPALQATPEKPAQTELPERTERLEKWASAPSTVPSMGASFFEDGTRR
ncbi:unnamed protein product, partial [Mesorhabditis spiculigera]